MDLSCNPFYILAASTQDSRQRIMERVDGCSLDRDPVQCREAAATLTHPRRRLLAEIAWLPAKKSEQAENICGLLKSSEGTLGALDRLRQVQNLLGTNKLMPIAKCNVLAAGMHHLPRHSSDEVETWILEFAWAFEAIDTEQVRKEINADRKESDFPVVNLPHIKAEIQKLQKYYLRVMTSVLKKLSGKERAAAITEVIESATDDEKQFPRLIDRLVVWYEIDAQKSFEEHETKIEELDKKLRLAADENHQNSVLASLVNQLTDAINDWHAVAHPIQINKKIKGLPHKDSKRVEKRVRGLALHLFHDYNKLSFCQQLIVTLQAVFADVVEISEALANDMNQLENIARRRGQNAQDAFTCIREQSARQDIKMRVQKLRSAADANKSESSLSRMANQLIQSVKNWNVLARPTETYHADYSNVANLVRELALYLWKEHGKPDFARQLFKMLQEEFADVDQIVTLIAEDIKALEAPECARLNVQVQAEKLRAAADAKHDDSDLSQMVNQLIHSVKKWKALAQPFESYRTDHYNVANLVRELARHLCHEHGKLKFFRQLMKMLQEVFAEIGKITTLIAEDIKALEAPERARLDVQVQAEKLRAAADAKHDDSDLSQMVNQLIQAVNEWETLTQPFESYRADYYSVANLAIELALYLWRECGKLDCSRQLLKMLQKVFADVHEIATLISGDIKALEAPERARLDVKVQAMKLRAAADAKQPDPVLSEMVNQLIQAVNEWKALAQPIKAYSADYYHVPYLVQELARHLLEEHGKLDNSRLFFKMLQQEFAEVDQIAALVAEHLDALEAVESACRHIEIQVKGLRDIVYAKHYHPDLSPMVNQLIQSVKGWRELAQPIKAYCGDYCSVAKLVLELAVNLRNKGKLRSSRQLTEMLQDIFGEIPEIATLLAEDTRVLNQLAQQRARMIEASVNESRGGGYGCLIFLLLGILGALLQAC